MLKIQGNKEVIEMAEEYEVFQLPTEHNVDIGKVFKRWIKKGLADKLPEDGTQVEAKLFNYNKGNIKQVRLTWKIPIQEEKLEDNQMVTIEVGEPISWKKRMTWKEAKERGFGSNVHCPCYLYGMAFDIGGE